MSIGDIASRLLRLDLAKVRAAALAAAAETMAGAVRQARVPAGSIGVAADGDTVILGSTDAAAKRQEFGAATAPPRPFLAPVAAEHAEAVAMTVGSALADALRSAVS